MTTSNNYGIGSTHNFRKEIEDTLRPAMERQTRADMQSEPSHEVVNKEISYRWGLEASAMWKLSNEELEVVYKNGWKPSEYVASRGVRDGLEFEVDIDRRTFMVRSVRPGVLKSSHMGRVLPW